jgi:hypothetical protein
MKKCLILTIALLLSVLFYISYCIFNSEEPANNTESRIIQDTDGPEMQKVKRMTIK